MGLSLTVGVFVVMAFSCISWWFITMEDTVFFVGLMAMVFMASIATGLAQNGTMATVNVLGSIYANAVMVGQAIAGVLPSIALIISILVVGEHTTEASGPRKDYGVFVYYITASLVALVSMSLLWWVNVYKSHNQYRLLNETLEGEQSIDSSANDVDEPEIQQNYVSFGVLWSKLKFIVSSIFFTFAVTLIFPVFASTVESVNYDSNFRLFKKDIFIPFSFLVWNLGDLLGRIWCGAPGSRFLINKPSKLITYSLARLVFIPLFLTCNIHPYTSASQSSALINSDLWYLMLQMLFGLSNGQLCTSCFMIVGNFCDTDDEKEAAGGFTAVFLSVGLAFGSVFSYLLVIAIN
ncbi:hypothetical protein PSN45_000280 [Yamadazyma tenuis]|nr:hypothetical protein PSN45_000280 [Yamadazyma tenuis]